MPSIDREIHIRAGGVYPFEATARYGHTRPPIPGLAERLRLDSGLILDTLAMIGGFAEHYGRIVHAVAPGPDAVSPYWGNGFVDGFDAIALYGMVAGLRPGRYVEIGSGNSTKFVRRAIADHGLDTRVTSIDPAPRAAIDQLCDHVLRQRFEDTDMALFAELTAGDVVFFDGSHRVFQNSDVVAFYLEAIPAMPPGVVIGIDDIFLPYDYPPHWEERMYSEQYLLAALLASGWRDFDILLPCVFASRDPGLAAAAQRVCAPVTGEHPQSVSGFWMRKRAQPRL